MLNLASFACALILFYCLLEVAEKVTFTNKIDVRTLPNLTLFVNSFPVQAMLKTGNQNVAEKEKFFGLEDLFGGGGNSEQANNAKKMFDLIDLATGNRFVSAAIKG